MRWNRQLALALVFNSGDKLVSFLVLHWTLSTDPVYSGDPVYRWSFIWSSVINYGVLIHFFQSKMNQWVIFRFSKSIFIHKKDEIVWFLMSLISELQCILLPSTNANNSFLKAIFVFSFFHFFRDSFNQFSILTTILVYFSAVLSDFGDRLPIDVYPGDPAARADVLGVRLGLWLCLGRGHLLYGRGIHAAMRQGKRWSLLPRESELSVRD